MDTCQRADVDAGAAFRIAIAVLLAEAITSLKADGGDEDDMLHIITSVRGVATQ